MAYKNSKGEIRYTNVDKMKFHTECADKGINPSTGEKLRKKLNEQRKNNSEIAESK